jgi:hypothetical protein
VKKLLQGAVKKLALLGAPVIPSSDDSLEQFLQAVGRFFGKDPAKWDQVGELLNAAGRSSGATGGGEAARQRHVLHGMGRAGR